MGDSLQAIQQLYDMGFIQEHEYLTRKQALQGGKPPGVKSASPPKQVRNTSPKRQPTPSQNYQVAIPSNPTPQFQQPTSRDFSRYDSKVSLVICPPPQFWQPIVDMKKNHMNPRIKRPPYPHITVLSPFVTFDRIEDAKRILCEQLAHIQPFSMSLDSIAMFDNGGSQTLYLDPQVSGNQLDSIYRTCKNNFPQQGKGDFVPHIGIAFLRNKGEARRLQTKYQSQWKSISFQVQEIYVMTRQGAEDPFQVHAVIPLGGKNPAPLMPPVR